MSAKSNLDFVSMTIRRYARRFRRLIVNYNDKTSIMIMIMMIGYEVQGILQLRFLTYRLTWQI